jgi:hypothetical protein
MSACLYLCVWVLVRYSTCLCVFLRLSMSVFRCMIFPVRVRLHMYACGSGYGCLFVVARVSAASLSTRCLSRLPRINEMTRRLAEQGH